MRPLCIFISPGDSGVRWRSWIMTRQAHKPITFSFCRLCFSLLYHAIHPPHWFRGRSSHPMFAMRSYTAHDTLYRIKDSRQSAFMDLMFRFLFAILYLLTAFEDAKEGNSMSSRCRVNSLANDCRNLFLWSQLSFFYIKPHSHMICWYFSLFFFPPSDNSPIL